MTDGYIEKGYIPTPADYEKIRRFTRKEFSEDELYIFEITLCSNDIDRDFEKFSVSALNELAVLFVGKTGIKDHSMKAADQTARIFETHVDKLAGRKTADGEDYYALRAKAYMVKAEENKAFITDIDAGIKKEISISCSMKKKICSVCGADRAKEYCAHIAGHEYDGKKCFTVLSEAADAYEFSFVAVPAQRDAGVEKSFDFKKGEFDMTEITKFLEGSGDIVLSRENANALSKYFSDFKENAELGKEYKKSLANEITRLCAEAIPQMDMKIFKGVAAVLTTKELLAFKKAFESNQAERNKPVPQLSASKNAAAADFSEFKI